MAWYPGAVRRPISRNYTARKTTKNALILHTDAGNSADLYGWWMHPENKSASSHFHVTKAGRVIQYIDTDHVSWANGAANSRSITFETQGLGNEPWTPAQVTALVQVLGWAARTHGIPIRQMRNSAVTETGIGWHRQGVNGNFPAGLLGGVRQNGGQVWSSAVGKECPGTLRIQQIPGIIAQLQGATIVPASLTTPTKGQSAPATSTGGLTVSDINTIIAKIEGGQRQITAVYERQREYRDSNNARFDAIDGRLAALEDRAKAQGTANQVNAVYVRQREYQAALEETIRQLAVGEGVTIDYDKIQAAAKAGAEAALAEGVEVEGVATVQISSKGA